MRMDRRLTRSRNSVIGGVAAGAAEWMNADPALVRIAWALLVPLTGGLALLAYIVAWIVVPEAPRPPESGVATPADTVAATTPAVEPRRIDEGRAGMVIGVGLVLIGLWFLAREYLPAIRWDFVWPLILVGIGILILVSSTRRR